MAYMSTEHAKEIRANLKKEFPDIKFAVQIDHHSGIKVCIMQSPMDFSQDFKKNPGSKSIQLNHYYLENYQNFETLKKIYGVINHGNHDKSDSMTDYFDVGFYVHMEIGQWDKPYKMVA